MHGRVVGRRPPGEQQLLGELLVRAVLGEMLVQPAVEGVPRLCRRGPAEQPVGPLVGPVPGEVVLGEQAIDEQPTAILGCGCF